MSIKNAKLREHEKALLDILANNLFNAGRKIYFETLDLNAVWREAYTQAVTLMAFHNSDSELLKSDDCEYIKRRLGQTLADTGGITLLSKIAGYNGETMADAGYIPGVGEGILTVCTIIPAIVYTLVFLIFKFGYNLDMGKLDVMYKALALKKNNTAGEEELTRNPQ